MKFEITQEFFFDAAHTLQRNVANAQEVEASRRIHGHTYHAAVSLLGDKQPATGVVTDLGHLRAAMAVLREELDHRFLDEVTGLGVPTLENLCEFIWRALIDEFPQLCRVRVGRKGVGDSCALSR